MRESICFARELHNPPSCVTWDRQTHRPYRGEHATRATISNVPGGPPQTDDLIDQLRDDVGHAIALLDRCSGTSSAVDWFREKDRILAQPDAGGSHLYTAEVLAKSGAGMGRPLEAVLPLPDSGLSNEEAEEERLRLTESMWTIWHQLKAKDTPTTE